MHNAVAMRRAQCCCNLNCYICCLSGSKATLSFQNVSKCATLHIFHGDEVGVVCASPVVHAHDVGVIQVGSGLSLAAKPLHKRWVGGIFRKQHLDRHGTVKQQVSCQKDIGHSAATNATLDFVAVIDNRAFFPRHKTKDRLPSAIRG